MLARELAAIYVGRGIDRETANAMADQVMSDILEAMGDGASATRGGPAAACSGARSEPGD